MSYDQGNKLRDKAKQGYLIVVNFDIPRCPTCRSILHPRDSKKRFLIDSSGEKHEFRLRRLLCEKCRKLHLEYPGDHMIPYSQYD